MNDRPAHAQCFVRSHDEPEPNVVSHGRFPDGSFPMRPAPKPTRTMAEARAKGLSVPEDLEYRGEPTPEG